MFWITLSILLGTIAVISLIYNAVKDTKIDALKYEVSYGNRSDNQIIIDNEHKLIIFQYKQGLMKPEAILKMSKALDDFGNKEYKLLVVDNTFNVSIK